MGKKRLIAVIISVLMVFSLVPAVSSAETEQTFKLPQKMKDGNDRWTEWDCVYFGSYPQTEIVDRPETSGSYGKNFCKTDSYEVDAELYEKLENAEYTSLMKKEIYKWKNKWKAGNLFQDFEETVIDGVRYRRQEWSRNYQYRKSDSKFNWADEWYSKEDREDIPYATPTYHYFRYEPIKWKVLEVEGDKALLVADRVLDEHEYNWGYDNTGSDPWEDSYIRSWLNGYDTSENNCYMDWTSMGFCDFAFSESEKDAIISQTLEPEGTTDRIFLLSNDDMHLTEKADAHGFTLDNGYTDPGYFETLYFDATVYARSVGAGESFWLRTTEGENGVQSASYDGMLDADTSSSAGVCPAIYLDLTSDKWSYAGKSASNKVTLNDVKITTSKDVYEVEYGETSYIDTCYQVDSRGIFLGDIVYSSDNEDVALFRKGRIYIRGTGEANLSITTPESNECVSATKTIKVIVKEGTHGLSVPYTEVDNYDLQYAKWDTLWYGHYPQTEIVNSPGDKYDGIDPKQRGYEHEVDEELWSKLEKAEYKDNETVIGGIRYRRYKDYYFKYHYFRYDKIKWRVLEKKGDTALVLADSVLDFMEESWNSQVTWKDSLRRSWLNGTADNIDGIDYTKDNFIDKAFSVSEKEDILETELDNHSYVENWENERCEDTTDRIFLLSETDVNGYGDRKNNCIARSHGFDMKTKGSVRTDTKQSDSTRKFTTTSYARVLGLHVLAGYSNWSLRSLGEQPGHFQKINHTGRYIPYSTAYADQNYGMLPAMRIDLSGGKWEKAGTTDSKGVITTDKYTNSVSVPKDTYDVQAEDKPFTIECESESPLTFESSDESVATVNRFGEVTPLTMGTAEITIKATETEMSTGKAEKKVTVHVGKGVNAVTGPADSYTKIHRHDEPFSLDAKAKTPLSYESDNEKVATVDGNGTVTVTGRGTAEITIKAAETEKYLPAEKKVRIVVNQSVPVINVQQEYRKVYGDEPFYIDAESDADIWFYERSHGSSGFAARVTNDGLVTINSVGYQEIIVANRISDEFTHASKIVKIYVVKAENSMFLTGTHFDKTVGDLSEKIVTAKIQTGIISSSTDSSVASVDSYGWLHINKVGSAVITIQTAENGCYKQSETETITVNVNKKDNAVTTVKDSYTKQVGEKSFNLGATAKTRVYYESSDRNIADVDSSGSVKIKRAGKAVITVTAYETEEYKGASKEIPIEVTKKANSLSVGQKEYELTCGCGEMIQISATAKTNLSYTSENTNVAKVNSSGYITPMGAGETVITVTAMADDTYASATEKVTVRVNRAENLLKVPSSLTISRVANLDNYSNTKCSFKSSNTKVVKVAGSGILTPVSLGKAVITVTAAETERYRGLSKKVTVTTTLGKSKITSYRVTKKSGGKAKKISVAWAKVPMASKYKLKVNGKTYYTTGTKANITLKTAAKKVTVYVYPMAKSGSKWVTGNYVKYTK